MVLISKEQALQSAKFFESRVGRPVLDKDGHEYFITDVVNDRLRVMDGTGASFWFDEQRAFAEPIRELKKEWRELGERITKKKARRA